VINGWTALGLVDFVPPPRAKPVKIIGSISNVDFARLKAREERDSKKLDSVIEYCKTPDNQKHDFLTNYFGLLEKSIDG
jgi:hypothetical protein